MTNRRGLNYVIETRAELSGLDAFANKISQVQKAWKDLKRSSGTLKLGPTKGSLEAIGKSVPKLKAVARYLRDINKSLNGIKGKIGTANKLFRTMDRDAKKSSRSIQKVERSASNAKRELTGAAKASATLGDRLRRAAVISGRILTIYAGFQIIRGVIDGLRTSVVEAFKFTDSIEKAELGIRALLFTMLDVRDEQGKLLEGAEAFERTTAAAKEQVRALRIEGLRTSATFQQLVETFQTALGPGLAAGLSLKEIREISVLVSQAAQAIGLPQEQLSEEIRSLITGTGTERTTRLAKQVLKIDSADIQRARETGELFDFLKEKLSGFEQASGQTLELLSTNLINLGDIARQSLGEALTGSFERVRDAAKRLNRFLGQDDGIISLNPEVLSLFSKLDEILQSIIQKGIEFAQDFDFQKAETAIDRLTTVSGVMVSAFSFLLGIVVDVAKFLGSIVLVATALLDALKQIPGVTKAWETSLKVVSAIITLILARSLYLYTVTKLQAAAVFLWNGALAVTRTVMLQIEALSIATNVQFGTTAGLLNAIAAAASRLLVVFAKIAVPIAAVILALGALITFLDDELGPQLEKEFENIWQSMVDGAKFALIDLETAFRKSVARIKDFFGQLDTAENQLDNKRRALQITDAQIEQASVFDPLLQGEASKKLLQTREALAKDIDILRDAVESAGELSGLEGVLAQIDADAERRVQKILTQKDSDKGGLSSIGDSLALIQQKFLKALGLEELVDSQSEEDLADLAVLTSKFNEAKQAYETLLKASERADDALALAKAEQGLQGVELQAAKVSTQLDQSIEKVVTLGSQFVTSLNQRISKLQGIDLKSDRERAELAALLQTLDDTEAKLANIEAVRQSTLGTQISALVQSERNARIERIRATREEVNTLRDISNVRQLLLDQQITAETAAAQIRLIRAEDEQAILVERIEMERDWLKEQAANENFLAEDRQTFFEASLSAQVELNLLTDKYKLSLEEINEELRKQQLLQDDPTAFGIESFFDNLKSKKEVIAQGTEDLLVAFSDGIVNVLGDSVYDALFSQENTIRERWEALMKDLSKILINTFFKSQFADIFADFSPGSGGGSGGSPQAVFSRGGKASGRGTASMAHFSRAAQAFSSGGRPAGIPASDTIPAWLTPDEWVVKRSSARMYGDKIMSLINDGAIDPAALQALASTSGRVSRTRRKAVSLAVRGYASGGAVAGSPRTGGGGLKVINALDEDTLAAAMAGKAGERVVLNHVLNSGLLRTQ